MSDAGGGGSPFDEHENDVQIPTFACPKCGQSLAVGTPICGNCGTILQGGTHVPEPLAARGLRPGPVIVFSLALALVVAGFLGREQIKDAFDSVGDTVEGSNPGAEDTTEIGGGGRGRPNRGGGGGGGEARAETGPRNVGAVVRELRAAGIPCTDMKTDSSDAYVATGSCQSNGSHVQINLYFQQQSIEFAEEFYADFAFASVHRDNWWISGETGLMRRIHQALGGRFQPPS